MTPEVHGANNWTIVSMIPRYRLMALDASGKSPDIALKWWRWWSLSSIPWGLLPRHRQYHRPIDSPEHLGCNPFFAAASVGRGRGERSPQAACGLFALVHGLTLRSRTSQIFRERMAKICLKRPGNLTRNTGS